MLKLLRLRIKFAIFNTKNTHRVLICSDKFKFSLSSKQVAAIIQNNLPKNIQSKIIQLADGGEGSLDVIANKIPGKLIQCQVRDPLFRKIKAKYFQSNDKQAYIQMNRASGLMLLAEHERNPFKTTTYGTGQLILDSLKRGITKINLFIGGSATNEGGIGCAQALGYRFYDSNYQRLQPIGQNLIKIAQIKQEDNYIKDLLSKSDIKVFTDVKNILTGKNGASYVYGPQKGTNIEGAGLLDRGLENLNQHFIKTFHINSNEIPGSGAAGGLGAGCLVLLKATIFRANLQQQIQWADLVITGEGKFDSQTMQGKAVQGVIDKCVKYNKPVLVFCAIYQKKQDHGLSNNVKVIEILNSSQKLRIQPQITRLNLQRQVINIFQQK